MAVKHFLYMIGRYFTIFSDHKPLQFAFSHNNIKDNTSPGRIRQLDFISTVTPYDCKHF